MAVDPCWDINVYHNKFEPTKHWELKQEFLLAHKEIIPEDKLVSLAQVYVNMELLGCRYPASVSNQVRKLSKGLGANYRDSRQNKLQRTFVKASDAVLAALRREGPVTSKQRNTASINSESTGRNITSLQNFVSQSSLESEDLSRTNQASCESLTGGGKSKISPEGCSVVSVATSPVAVSDDAREKHQSEKGMDETCPVSANLLPDTDAGSKKIPVHLTVPPTSKATEKLEKIDNIQTVSVNQSKGNIDNGLTAEIKARNSEENSQVSNNGLDCNTAGECTDAKSSEEQSVADNTTAVIKLIIKSWSSTNAMERILLVHRQFLGPKEQKATSILTYSAQFNKMVFKIKSVPCTKSWEAYIDNSFIESLDFYTGFPEEAKQVLATRVLKKMCALCCLMVIKKKHDGGGEAVSTDRVAAEYRLESVGTGSSRPSEPPIGGDSVGCKMLQMMGWKGGGLGKQGQGISDPIQPLSILDRTGLGFREEDELSEENVGEVTDEFERKIHDLLTKFVREVRSGTSDRDDLVFSPNFSREQRAFIHELAPYYDLKHQSYGAGSERYLVLSPKLTMRQRLLSILNNDRNSGKFSLHAPGSYDLKMFSLAP